MGLPKCECDSYDRTCDEPAPYYITAGSQVIPVCAAHLLIEINICKDPVLVEKIRA